MGIFGGLRREPRSVVLFLAHSSPISCFHLFFVIINLTTCFCALHSSQWALLLCPEHWIVFQKILKEGQNIGVALEEVSVWPAGRYRIQNYSVLFKLNNTEFEFEFSACNADAVKKSSNRKISYLYITRFLVNSSYEYNYCLFFVLIRRASVKILTAHRAKSEGDCLPPVYLRRKCFYYLI